jgi:hypothetical protein
MIAVVLATALALSPNGAPPAAKTACKADQPVAARSDQSVKPKKLGELPNGVLLRAVLLTVGNCPAVEEREPTGFASPAWRWTLRTTGGVDVAPAAEGR